MQNTTETSLNANGILFYMLFKLPKLDAAPAQWFTIIEPEKDDGDGDDLLRCLLINFLINLIILTISRLVWPKKRIAHELIHTIITYLITKVLCKF